MTTIGDLRDEGRRLAIDCGHCGRLRYLNINRFSDDALVEDLAAAMKCTRCLSTDVAVRIIDRDEKTGYWPAERS